MENVADALKMAAAVLIFVLALSITIGAFGQVRQSSQIIFSYKDRDYDYGTYLDENIGNTERVVGVETIIPSIYKAYIENYKIVFDIQKLKLDNKGLYKKQKVDGSTYEPVYSIDLANDMSLGNDTRKEQLIKAILYGKNAIDGVDNFEKELKIQLNSEGIYDIIKENGKLKEKLGVYYQEEITGSTESPDANKTKKRVITYTDQG